jgi:hypothetical protein
MARTPQSGGTDTLQAEALAIRCAEQGGGIVFPPLYYVKTARRTEEANADDHEAIAAAMGLEPDRFAPDFSLLARPSRPRPTTICCSTSSRSRHPGI